MKAVGSHEVTSGTSTASKETVSNARFLGTATLQAREKLGSRHCSDKGSMQVSRRPGKTLLGCSVNSDKEDRVISSQMSLSGPDKDLGCLEGIGVLGKCRFFGEMVVVVRSNCCVLEVEEKLQSEYGRCFREMLSQKIQRLSVLHKNGRAEFKVWEGAPWEGYVLRSRE